jgi:DNA (cytosine-5)-methyltransferase 1
MNISILSIGMNRGAKRVWLQGGMLSRAGFDPKTRYAVTRKDSAIVLTKHAIGFRIVSAKRKADKEVPVIDINNAELLAMFDGLDHVRVIYKTGEIHILPLATELRARERLARAEELMRTGQPLEFGSIAHGMGVLDDALCAGFERQGVTSKLKFANEIRLDLTDHAMSLGRTWSRETIALNGKMQELAFDEYVMKKVGRCDFLSAGLPCSAASVAGRAKRKLSHPEAHPEVGHLVVAFIAMIARFNPLAILLENVVPYAQSASMDILRNHLIEMGYDLHETVIDGADWNALENRKRFVTIGITKGIPFSFAELVMPAKIKRTLAEILEPVAFDDPRWSTMEGLKSKELRDAAENKSFAMQIFDASSEGICTLTKGMQRNRSTDAKIRHPQNPELLRIPTPVEHARAKAIPTAMIADLCPTIAHEGLGQSVIYPAFVAIGELLARSFKSLLVKSEEKPFELACC